MNVNVKTEEFKYRAGAVTFAAIFGWVLASSFLVQIEAEPRAALLVFSGCIVAMTHLMVFWRDDVLAVGLPEAAAHILAGLTWLVCLLAATFHWHLALRELPLLDRLDYRLGLIILMTLLGSLQVRRTWVRIRRE